MQHDGGPADHRPATTVASWPRGSFVENLAVDGEGQVYVTLHTERAVVRVDPATGTVTPFASFDTPVAGLVFGADGTLFVGGGTPGQAPGVVWRVDRAGAVGRVVDLPDAPFLNGMTLHPDGRRLLVAESIGGCVYVVDPASGATAVWLADAQLRPDPESPGTPGANGIKLHRGAAFISVTARDRVLRTPLAADGTPGPLAVAAERLRADDFAVAADGSLVIATHPACSLVRLAPDGTRATLATQAHGMTGATAVAFGRRAEDRRSVYVTTTGGTMTLPEEALETARLVRVDVGIEAAA